MGEARKIITIVNRRGLHARASAKFVNMVAGLPAGVKVTVSKAPNSAAGGSILGLMMLGAAKGDVIELLVEGEAADSVLVDLAMLVETGFGED